jgi:hypothetical protein
MCISLVVGEGWGEFDIMTIAGIVDSRVIFSHQDIVAIVFRPGNPVGRIHDNVKSKVVLPGVLHPIDIAVESIILDKRTTWIRSWRLTKRNDDRIEAVRSYGCQGTEGTSLRVSRNNKAVVRIFARVEASLKIGSSSGDRGTIEEISKAISSFTTISFKAGVVVVLVNLGVSEIHVLVPVVEIRVGTTKGQITTALLLGNNRLIWFFRVKLDFIIVRMFIGGKPCRFVHRDLPLFNGGCIFVGHG